MKTSLQTGNESKRRRKCAIVQLTALGWVTAVSLTSVQCRLIVLSANIACLDNCVIEVTETATLNISGRYVRAQLSRAVGSDISQSTCELPEATESA